MPTPESLPIGELLEHWANALDVRKTLGPDRSLYAGHPALDLVIGSAQVGGAPLRLVVPVRPLADAVDALPEGEPDAVRFADLCRAHGLFVRQTEPSQRMRPVAREAILAGLDASIQGARGNGKETPARARPALALGDPAAVPTSDVDVGAVAGSDGVKTGSPASADASQSPSSSETLRDVSRPRVSDAIRSSLASDSPMPSAPTRSTEQADMSNHPPEPGPRRDDDDVDIVSPHAPATRRPRPSIEPASPAAAPRSEGPSDVDLGAVRGDVDLSGGSRQDSATGRVPAPHSDDVVIGGMRPPVDVAPPRGRPAVSLDGPKQPAPVLDARQSIVDPTAASVVNTPPPAKSTGFGGIEVHRGRRDRLEVEEVEEDGSVAANPLLDAIKGSAPFHPEVQHDEVNADRANNPLLDAVAERQLKPEEPEPALPYSKIDPQFSPGRRSAPYEPQVEQASGLADNELLKLVVDNRGSGAFQPQQEETDAAAAHNPLVEAVSAEREEAMAMPGARGGPAPGPTPEFQHPAAGGMPIVPVYAWSHVGTGDPKLSASPSPVPLDHLVKIWEQAVRVGKRICPTYAQHAGAPCVDLIKVVGGQGESGDGAVAPVRAIADAMSQLPQGHDLIDRLRHLASKAGVTLALPRKAARGESGGMFGIPPPPPPD